MERAAGLLSLTPQHPKIREVDAQIHELEQLTKDNGFWTAQSDTLTMILPPVLP